MSGPSILVDEARARQNIAAFVSDPLFCNKQLRPHFKTHQSARVGAWFHEAGITQITVSSLSMAAYFCSQGWDDILIALPAFAGDAAAYDALAGQCKLSLLCDDVQVLEQLCSTITQACAFYLKADCGYGRAGIPVLDSERFIAAVALLQRFPQHHFAGLLSHFGNTYHAASVAEIIEINRKATTQLRKLKQTIEKEWGVDCGISIGDTPSLRYYTKEILEGISELRPGNFVYYDVMQLILGTCSAAQISVAMDAPLLSVYPARKEALVHAGAVHLSKESCRMPDGGTGYGMLVRIRQNSIAEVLEGCYVDRLSQEHGILRCTDAFFNEFKAGDRIGILPVHSCLMVAAMKDNSTEGANEK